jgi:hypothetical protein
MAVPHDGRALASPAGGGGHAGTGAGRGRGGAPARARTSARRSVGRRAGRSHRLLVVVLAAALPAACRASERKPTADTSAVLVAPPAPESLPPGKLTATDSARFRYWSFAGRFGESRSGLVARFGAPRSTSSDTLRNQHDPGVVDSLVTLWYAGFSVRFFVGSSGNEFPLAVSVTDSSIGLPLPVGIGSRRSAIDHYFGTPDYEKSRGDSLLTQFVVPSAGISPGDNEVVFVLVGNTVRRIEWVYYID